MDPRFYCPCTRARALRTLSLLDVEEIEELVTSGASQEVVCEFCGRAYQIEAHEMRLRAVVSTGDAVPVTSGGVTAPAMMSRA